MFTISTFVLLKHCLFPTTQNILNPELYQEKWFSTWWSVLSTSVWTLLAGEQRAQQCNLMILWQIIQHTHPPTSSPHLNPHYLYECIDWRSCSTWGAEISHCSISIYSSPHSPPSVYLHVSTAYHPCIAFTIQQTCTLLGCGWSHVSASKQTQDGVRLQGFVRVFMCKCIAHAIARVSLWYYS